MSEQEGMEIGKYNERGELEVEIREEFTKTGGHFQAQSFTLDVAGATGMYSADYSFPMPVSLFCAQIAGSIDMDGDEGGFYVGPNTIIGAITSDVSAGATGINVSPTVTANADVGYYLELFDGTNTDDMGRALDVDTDDNTVLMETPSTNSFSASTPTYVRMTLKLVPKLVFSNAKSYEFGRSRIGGSYVPTGTILRLLYNNISGTAKQVRLTLEYLY